MQGGNAPAVSVVVPARDAADTIVETLESLVRQDERSFEAIVVDDGSSDGTAELADMFAQRDTRFRVLRGSARGVSAARNAGLARARGEWLLFLDADDWLEPEALRVLLSRAREPDADAVVCGWARVASDGEPLVQKLWDKPDQALDCFATTCAFAIHACLVRRELIASLGGFDASLVTCEDWELWQRAARAGARFVVVDECLALYRMRAGAASSAARRMLIDGLEVIGRGHGPGGRDGALLTQTRLACACYAAGLALGAGEDARALLDELGDDRDPDLDAASVAECIVEAIGLPSCCPPAELGDLWPEVEPRLEAFLSELELRASRGLAKRTQRLIERMVLERAEARAPLTVGSTHAVRVELSRPLEDVTVDPHVERLSCAAEWEGEPLARVELPVCDGVVPATVLADALAAETFWTLLCRFLGRTDAAAWDLFLRELWGAPADRAPTVWAAAGWVTVEVSDPVPHVRVADSALNVEVTLGGAPVGVVQVRAERGCVAAHELRSAITDECGLELALVTVREALFGQPLPSGASLRALVWAAAARRPKPLLDHETLLIPRWSAPVRGPASRRAALPVAAAADVMCASGSALMLGVPPARVLYEPAVQRRSVAPAPPGEHSVSETSTETTSQLPILMYHRIADRGPEALRRYRLSPSALDEQLHRLREHGFRGVTVGEWLVACRSRRPLPGRAVLLTFDDGYSDFAEHAWPLLERHGFPATVFVVTDAAGRTGAWDADRGDAPGLMGWDEIRELARRGIEFGSHTSTHPALCGLSNAEVVRELVNSRAVLEEQLGTAVSALAYPYGDHDGAIAHLAGACGYEAALTCDPRHAELTDNSLRLPRFEIRGDFTPADFDRTLAPQ